MASILLLSLVTKETKAQRVEELTQSDSDKKYRSWDLNSHSLSSESYALFLAALSDGCWDQDRGDNMVWLTKSLSAKSLVIWDVLSISKQISNSPYYVTGNQLNIYIFFSIISFNPYSILLIEVLNYVHLIDEETEMRKVKECTDVFTNQRAFS